MAMKIYKTPLSKIEEIYAYFRDPANMPLVTVASDKTHYAWQHMSNYFGSESVLREGAVSELQEREDPAIGALNVTFTDGSTKTVDEQFKSSSMDAMVVIREGIVVYERYKTMRPRDKHMWYSCSKTLEGVLLALLVHEGKVDDQKFVSEYVPELKDTVWDTVTVEETADMATGLDSTEHEVPDARTNPEQGWYQWAVSIGVFEDAKKLNETQFDVWKRIKRVKPGHTVFEYNSMNTAILMVIIENVTGVPFAEFYSERIWSKIGAQNDGYLALDKNGHALGWGFMNSTLRDLARWGMVFTPSAKKLNKETIIPEAVIKKFHTGLRPEMYGKGAVGKDFVVNFPVAGLANRYMWDLITPDGDQFKSGVGGQGVYISAAADTVVAFFSTGTQEDEYRGAWMARNITQMLLQS